MTQYCNINSDIISGTRESDTLYGWVEGSSGALSFDVGDTASTAAVQLVYLFAGLAMRAIAFLLVHKPTLSLTLFN